MEGKSASWLNTIIVFLIMAFVSPLYSQVVLSKPSVDSIKHYGFTDSLVKSEIALFTVKGASIKTQDSLRKEKLKEIPVRYCTNMEVNLWWSTFTSKVSTFIHIYFKGAGSERALDSTTKIQVIF